MSMLPPHRIHPHLVELEHLPGTHRDEAQGVAGPARDPEPIARQGSPGIARGYYLQLPDQARLLQDREHAHLQVLRELLGQDQVPLWAPFPLPTGTPERLMDEAPWAFAIDLEALPDATFERFLACTVEAHQQLRAVMDPDAPRLGRPELAAMLLEIAPRIMPCSLLEVVYTRPNGAAIELHPRAEALLGAWLALAMPRVVPSDALVDLMPPQA